MTDRTRIRIAAAATALFLAGISAAGLAARDSAPSVATPNPGAAAGDPAPAGDDGRDEAGYAEIVEKALGIDEKTRDALDDVAGLVRRLQDDE